VGQPILAAAAFQAASLLVEKSRLCNNYIRFGG
jgi:hypothetical protein